jgi:hypothetical protein
MLVFNSNTKKNRFVKTKSKNIIKVAVSGLAVASLLALGIFLQIKPASTDSTAADTVSFHHTSPVNAGSSFDSAANRDARAGYTDTGTAEREPGEPCPPDPADIASPLAYTINYRPAYEREPLEFVLSATDADGDSLVYSASNLPEGASFDAGTHTFSWTPRYDQAGVYTVHFEVSDGVYTDEEDVTITVVQLYEDWDVNGDGSANVLDMVLIGQHWGEAGLTGWIQEDANEDGEINVLDIIIIGQNWTG